MYRSKTEKKRRRILKDAVKEGRGVEVRQKAVYVRALFKGDRGDDL